MVRYSVCITNLDSVATLRASLDSILPQLGGLDVEYVVVDGGSTDGSLEVLREYEGKRDDFRVVVEPGCGRGRGRTVASGLARGTYEIHHIDMDQVYHPVLRGMLDYYHEQEDRRGPLTMLCDLVVTTRALMAQVGRYPDVVSHEDAWTMAALSRAAPFLWLPCEFSEHRPRASRKTLPGALRETYQASVDVLRLGVLPPVAAMRYIQRGKRSAARRALAALPFLGAWATMPFRSRVPFPLPGVNRTGAYDFVYPHLGDVEDFVGRFPRGLMQPVEAALRDAEAWRRRGAGEADAEAQGQDTRPA